MPTYEYACSKCHHEFEQFQSMNDAPLTRCPQCGKKALKRLVGAGAGLIFKGSGFYITDYKNAGTGKKDGGDAKPAEAKPAESKPADAKPAATKPGDTKAASPSAPSSAKSAGGSSKT